VATYEQARADEFSAASTHSITGVELAVPADSPLTEGGLIPIHVCVCVIEPCDCDGPIIWVGPDDIRSHQPTERSNRAGDDVVEFKIDPDATILVESVVRAKMSDLTMHGRRARLRPSSHLRSTKAGGCGGGSSTMRDYRAGGSYYDGQECAGHTLYDVWVEADGLDTTFYYVAVGSC